MSLKTKWTVRVSYIPKLRISSEEKRAITDDKISVNMNSGTRTVYPLWLNTMFRLKCPQGYPDQQTSEESRRAQLSKYCDSNSKDEGISWTINNGNHNSSQKLKQKICRRFGIKSMLTNQFPFSGCYITMWFVDNKICHNIDFDNATQVKKNIILSGESNLRAF